jgi:hypothetical protein
VASGPTQILAGEFVTLRVEWSARRAPVQVTYGAEWVEVDAGQGFEPHAEAGFSEECPVSAPIRLRSGQPHVSEHRVGLAPKPVPPGLCCLPEANAALRFVFERQGRYRVRLRYDEAASNAIDIQVVAPAGRDALVWDALRPRPIVLTGFARVEPEIRAEAEALVRAHGRHRYLRPFLQEMLRSTHAEGPR